MALNLKVLRAYRGLTLREASEQAGIGPTTICHLENPDHPLDIRLSTLDALSKCYGVPYDAILHKDGAVGWLARSRRGRQDVPAAKNSS
jgi:transcriptional regulator with XRE-family HTH domain